MPLCFLHTSDWHLGRADERLGPRAKDVSRRRLDAIRRIWTLAREHEAAFVLVAGDTFHTDTPTSNTLSEAVTLLREAPCPVVLLPGHADPCEEGSVWFLPDFADALRDTNIHLALSTRSISLGEALILPAPTLSRRDGDPTPAIEVGERDSEFRIGLAHDEASTAASDVAEALGLDYLALGGAHEHGGEERIWRSGAPEGGGAGELNPGFALLVEIASPGEVPRVTPQRVGTIRPIDWGEIELQAGDANGAWERLRRAVREIEDPSDALLRLRLRGALPLKELRAVEEWMSRAGEKLLALDVVSELVPEPSPDDWAALRLAGAEARVLELLQAPLVPADLEGVRDASTVADWSEDEAARREARALLFALLQQY